MDRNQKAARRKNIGAAFLVAWVVLLIAESIAASHGGGQGWSAGLGMIGLMVCMPFGIVFLAWGALSTSSTVERFCISCHYSGEIKTHPRGSAVIELLLWLFLILPGVIYTVWRRSGIETTCPKCGGHETIPVDSPRAQQLLAKA